MCQDVLHFVHILPPSTSLSSLVFWALGMFISTDLVIIYRPKQTVLFYALRIYVRSIRSFTNIFREPYFNHGRVSSSSYQSQHIHLKCFWSYYFFGLILWAESSFTSLYSYLALLWVVVIKSATSYCFCSLLYIEFCFHYFSLIASSRSPFTNIYLLL